VLLKTGLRIQAYSGVFARSGSGEWGEVSGGSCFYSIVTGFVPFVTRDTNESVVALLSSHKHKLPEISPRSPLTFRANTSIYAIEYPVIRA
jgi:hypothetical protein